MESKEAIVKLNVLSSYDTEKEKREEYKECIYAIIKDLEVLDILKPFLKRSLRIEKIDLTKEENKIYKGYLPKDYNKTYIYKWDYNYSVWNVLLDEENAIKLKEWLEK